MADKLEVVVFTLTFMFAAVITWSVLDAKSARYGQQLPCCMGVATGSGQWLYWCCEPTMHI